MKSSSDKGCDAAATVELQAMHSRLALLEAQRQVQSARMAHLHRLPLELLPAASPGT